MQIKLPYRGLAVECNSGEINFRPRVDAASRHRGSDLKFLQDEGRCTDVSAVAPHIAVAVPRSMCSGLPNGRCWGRLHRDEIALIAVSDLKGLTGIELNAGAPCAPVLERGLKA